MTSSYLRSILLVSIVASILISVSVVSAADVRPSAFGYAPAQPKKVSDVVLTSPPPGNSRLSLIELRLYVSKKGKVDSLQAVRAVDARLAAFFDPYLKGFEFHPAELDGKKLPSTLPIELRLFRNSRYPFILFPVDEKGYIGKRRLFNEALRLAGFELPMVQWFPAFHAEVSLYDSLISAPFTVIEVELDANGQALGSHIVHDAYPDFGQQLENAVLWSRFEPARQGGNPVVSRSFLVVSYFPEISYPTLPFDRSRIDSLAFLKRYQLTVLPDTFGLARLPVPARLTGDLWWPGKKGRIDVPSVTALINIDTSGAATVKGTDMTSAGNQAFANTFITSLRFYPAVSFDGRPVAFQGIVVLRQGDRGSVRIEYDWLK